MSLLILLNDADPVEYTPTIDDIGALLRARTKASYTHPTESLRSEELGTFNEYTRPTGEEVGTLIAQAVDEVWARLGQAPVVAPLDEATLERFFPRARRTTALYTAMLVELSYFPEQPDQGQSAYDRFKDLFDQAMQGLVNSVTTDPGDTQGITSMVVASPTRSAAIAAAEGLPWPGEWT